MRQFLPIEILGVVVLLGMSLVMPVGAQSVVYKIDHDFWLEPLSYITYPLNCNEGESIGGEFLVLADGDQYGGDQQKYDIWPSSGGISVLVLTEADFLLWSDDSTVEPVFSSAQFSRLIWRTNVSESGQYIVVYSNDAIYMKRVQGFTSISTNDDGPWFRLSYNFITPVLFLAVTIALFLLLIRRRLQRTIPRRGPWRISRGQ